jgi:hypothetical protein
VTIESFFIDGRASVEVFSISDIEDFKNISLWLINWGPMFIKTTLLSYIINNGPSFLKLSRSDLAPS